MKKDLSEKAKGFVTLNEMAIKGEVAVFGSDYLYDFPFYDFMQGTVTDYVVYNRSLEGLTVSEAKNLYEYCLKSLDPKTILLSFGDTETIDEKFYQDYSELIKKVTSSYPHAKVYVMQTPNKDEQTNERIKRLVAGTTAQYVSLDPEETSLPEVFRRLSNFFRGGKISFCDAFSIC